MRFSSRVGYQRFPCPRILRWKMCKKAYCLIVLLFSSAWANAQQSQPGYAVLIPDPGSVRSSNSMAASGPPEPGALGGQGSGPPAAGTVYPPAAGGYLPGFWRPRHGRPRHGWISAHHGGRSRHGCWSRHGCSGRFHAHDDDAAGRLHGRHALPVVGATSTFGSEQFWLTLGYATGWIQKPRLSTPLITEGSASDAHPGALGQANTVIAFGDNNYKFGTYQGMQAQVGVNLNDQIYLEVNAQFFPTQHMSWTTGSDGNGNPLIARPVLQRSGWRRAILPDIVPRRAGLVPPISKPVRNSGGLRRWLVTNSP